MVIDFSAEIDDNTAINSNHGLLAANINDDPSGICIRVDINNRRNINEEMACFTADANDDFIYDCLWHFPNH